MSLYQAVPLFGLMVLASCATSSKSQEGRDVFSAKVSGDVLVLEVSKEPAYTEACRDDFAVFYKTVNGRDERLPTVITMDQEPGDLGCDVFECVALDKTFEIPLPTFQPTGPNRAQPMNDRRGHFRLEYTYFADEGCQKEKTFNYEFDVHAAAANSNSQTKGEGAP